MTALDYIKKFKPYAIWEHIRTGIPASVTLAQGMIESNEGNSILATQYNNHFGIKAYSNPDNLPVVYLTDDYANEPFRVYKTPYQSYRDHSDFLLTNPRYQDTLKTNNYIEFANALKAAGYATAPGYAALITDKIAKYGLHKYDFFGNNKYIFAAILLLIIAAIITISIEANKSNPKKQKS